MATRKEMRLSSNQMTSSIASSIFESSDGFRTSIHHPRESTARKRPYFPPLGSLSQSGWVGFFHEGGQSPFRRHFGWLAVHHSVHASSKVCIDVMDGRLLGVLSRLRFLNHQATSRGRRVDDNLQGPYHTVSKRHKFIERNILTD